MLFNRQVRGKLPCIERNIVINRHAEARENEAKSQSYHKQYADKRRNAKESTITVGDRVLVKQILRNKITPRFNHTPCCVISRKGSRVTAKNKHGHYATRNISHFKKFAGNTTFDDSESEDNASARTHKDNDAVPTHQADQQSDHGDVKENEHVLNRRSDRARKVPERYGNPIPSNLIY